MTFPSPVCCKSLKPANWYKAPIKFKDHNVGGAVLHMLVNFTSYGTLYGCIREPASTGRRWEGGGVDSGARWSGEVVQLARED